MIMENSLHIWELNNTLFNNPWVKNKSQRKLEKKLFKLEENKNVTFKNLWNMTRMMFIA